MNTAWFGDEAVAVESGLLADGKLRPTAFTWRGQHWRVIGLGRQWENADGQHVLVITADGSRFELCLSSNQRGWRLLRAWERPHMV